jgi:hypothetical protein
MDHSDESEDRSLLEQIEALQLQVAKLEEEEEKKVSLALPGRHIFHRVIAAKVNEGQQLRFIIGGESHYGFPIGLDDEWVQIYCTGTAGYPDQPINSYEIEHPWRKWIQIAHIEHLEENLFCVRHLTADSLKRLDNERKAMLRDSKSFLYGPDNRNRRP